MCGSSILLLIVNEIFCTLVFKVPEFRTPEPKSG